MIHINCGAASGASGGSPKRKSGEVVLRSASAGYCHHIVTKKTFVTEFVDGVTGSSRGLNYTKFRSSRERNTVVDRFNLYKNLPQVKKSPFI